MNNGTINRRGVARRKSSGFTLVELMVSMLLGLVVIAGVSSVFLSNQNVYRANQSLNDVQDGSRVAFEMLARNIREAGLTGCDNSGRIANIVNNSATTWWANWNSVLVGYDSTTADPNVAVGTGVGQRVAGNDSITVLGGGDAPLTLASDSEPAGSMKINETTSNLATGDVVMVCDPDHSVMMQISAYSNGSFSHTTAGTPGNCSGGLGYPAVCTASGNTYQYGPNALLAKVQANDWYIGNYQNADGTTGTSLYRLTLNNVAGVPTAQAQEMVRDVTKMTIAYHQQGNTSFVPATTVAANWGQVDAVQVTLTLQGSNKRAGINYQPITRTFVSTSTVRNRVN